MNTQLNNVEQYTNPFINTYGIESFQKIIEAFRNKSKKTGLNAGEHILYNLVRNLPEDRGFTPIKNMVKIANGQHEYQGFKFAKMHINSQLKYYYNTLVIEFNLPLESQSYWTTRCDNSIKKM